jgi:voltage-gated sodium channel
MTRSPALVVQCRRLAESTRFQSAILIVILANAALVGFETSTALVARHQALFSVLNAIILAIFVAELAIRITAHGLRFGAFLRDGWNLFDFVIVTLSLLPGVGAFATVARMARVLRVARLVSVSPKLRLIVGTMTRSIPSLAHVSLLLALLLYLYAVIGVNLFGAHDGEHWGSLGRALLTLFQMLTLEGWVELQAASMKVKPWAWVYFGSFVIIAVFVVVNLFIAVVLNNLDEIREEDRRAALEAKGRAEAALPEASFERHLAAIRVELERLEALYRVQTGDAPPGAPHPPAGAGSGVEGVESGVVRTKRAG